MMLTRLDVVDRKRDKPMGRETLNFLCSRDVARLAGSSLQRDDVIRLIGPEVASDLDLAAGAE